MPSSSHRPRVVVIGAGFAGIGMAVALRRAGTAEVTVLERGSRVGGVWAANSYPGAACDIPATLYSFSFAPKADWSRRYPPQPEIQRYLEEVAEREGVLPLVRFGATVTGARFDDDRGTWQVSLADGGSLEADVLVPACGQLSTPVVPDLPGLADFAGTAFHSAAWRHDHDLTGRRVAVVGTGASAVQFVPHVVGRAAHTTVVQVDPPHVISKPDRRYGPLLRAAFARLPGLLALNRGLTYLQYEWRAVGFTRWPGLLRLMDGRARRHREGQVRDAALRRVVTPRDFPGCKRILLADDYYPALDRDGVRVVTEPVVRVTASGLVTADGAEHPVDTVVWGTGFRAAEFLPSVRVTGAGGVDLRTAWRDGAEAYLGIAVSGFPNLFLLYGPNTNLGHNSIVHMIESQVRYVAAAVGVLAGAGPGATLDVRPEVQARFGREVQQRISTSVWERGCTSWYRTASGRNTTNWPGFSFAYRRRTRRFDVGSYEMTARAG